MEQQEISEKVCLFAGYVCVTGFRNGFPVELQITDVQQDNTSKKTTGDERSSCGTCPECGEYNRKVIKLI